MSLSTTPKTGLWMDQSNHHRLQLLLDTSSATWITVAVAACFTLSTPYNFRIIRHSLVGINRWARASSTPSSEISSDERQPLRPREIVQSAKSGRGAATKFAKALHKMDSGPDPHDVAEMALSLVCYFVAFVGLVVAVGGYLSTKIATDQSALLDATRCGLYEYDDERGGEEDAARADIWMSERERRAAEYAQDCYAAENKAKAMQCGFFYNSTIGFTRKEDKCPFINSAICAFGYQQGSAVTFDTGVVDSSVMGINYNPTHKFRRTSTCAPLSAEKPYVRHFRSGTDDDGYFLYYYGSLYDANCSQGNPEPPQRLTDYTMRIPGHPFNWMAPVYRVDPYATSLFDPVCDTYQPIPELQSQGLAVPRTKTLSIIFVTALHILYSKPSNDPVFPANQKFRRPGDTKDYYYNSSPKARAFACIDETQLCAPSGSPCWTATDPIPRGVANTSAYWFMKYALKQSNTYDSIKYRLGSALLAQQRVGQSRSLPLPDNHWEDEAELLFKTTLARAQFDAWSIASGEDRDVATYTDTLPDEAKGKMCGLFKFNSVGYTNIQIGFLLFMFILAAPLSWALSCKTNEPNFMKPYVRLMDRIKAYKKKLVEPRTASSPTDNSDQQDPFVVGSSTNSPQTSDELPVPEPPATGSTDPQAAQGSDLSLPITTIAGPSNNANYGSIAESSVGRPASGPRYRTSSVISGAYSQRGEPEGNPKKADDEWSPLVFHSLIWDVLWLAKQLVYDAPKYAIDTLRNRKRKRGENGAA